MTKLTKAKPTRRVTRLAKPQRRLHRGLTERVVWHAIDDLKPFPGNPRRHPESQIAGLMKSIGKVGTNPILIDESAMILAGHGRLEAAKRLGMSEVPTITISGLSPAEKRAILIADNRLPERAVWDIDVLRGHFKDLIEIDFDVELTGFTTGEIDLVLDGRSGTLDPADDLSGLPLDRPAVSKMGDRWELGRHQLICGDALRGDNYQRLLGGEVAQMIVTDPPFNVKIHGHAMGRGTIRHREFKVASGEMSESEFTAFLEEFIRLAVRHSQDGSIHFLFMDWRHLPELLAAAGRSTTNGRTCWSGTRATPARAASTAASMS
jgi:ParB-like nuclease domain